MIIHAECGKPLVIGIGGEDQVTAVTFDISEWVEAYGPGSVQLVHRRAVDPDATPVPVTFADGVVTWPITAADTAYQGVGEAQLIYTPVNRTKKSEIFQTVVDRALTSPAEVPIPMRGWVQQVLETAEATVEETEELAEAAAASAADAAESARHLTIDDTLTQQGQAADAAATGDKFRNAEGGVINSLLSAAPFTTFEVGGYNFSNGKNNDLPNRIRTQKSYISTAKKIACIDVAPGYKFGVCVHSGVGLSVVYHGAWDGVDFYTDVIWQTGPVFFGNIDKTANYQYSITIAKADDSSISTSDGPDALKVYYATDAALETEGVPADAKATGDKIAEAISTASAAVAALGPDSTLSVSGKAADAAATGDKIKNAEGGITNSLLSAAPYTTFNVGGYKFSDGTTTDLPNRIRTVRASVDTSKRIACIAVATGYKFGVIVHTGAGAGIYYGAWDGVKFYTDAVWQTGPVFFGNIDKNAGYRYSVVIAKTDDSSISTSDGPDALKVYYATDDALETEGVPADAKVTGDKIKNNGDKIKNAEGGITNGLLSAAPFVTFQDGGYKFSDGDEYSATGTRIRTKKSSVSTAKKIACIAVAPGYKFGVCVHSGAGLSLVYHGAWNGVDFYTDVIWQTGPVFFGNIDKTANYQYSITIAKADDSSISTSDGPNALKVYYATDEDLETAGVPADAKAVGDAIETAVSNLTPNPADMVPDYYFANDYIKERVETIRGIMMSRSQKGDAFVWLTDPHYYNNSPEAPENGMQGVPLIAYLMQQVNIGQVFLGGDYYNSVQMELAEAKDVSAAVRRMWDPIWDKTYSIIGNHEYNNPNNADATRDKELKLPYIYQMLVKDKEQRFGGLDLNEMSYYIDNPAQKIRYFFLHSTLSGLISIYTVHWFARQMESVPDGYTVVVLSHIGLVPDSRDAETVHLPEIDPLDPTNANNRWAHIWHIMDAAKAKTTYTIVSTDSSTTYDYSNVNIDVACAITGHNHRDAYQLTDGGIPIISTIMDRAGRAITPTMSDYGKKIHVVRERGTIGEQAFEVVNIDTEARKIYMTRIGGSVVNAVYDAVNDAVVDADDYDSTTGDIQEGATRYDAKDWVLHSIDEGYCDREFSY